MINKTLAQAIADLKGHNCTECEELTEEQIALNKRLATEKLIHLKIDYTNEDSKADTTEADGFCVAGIILVGDDLNGGFEALSFASGAFSEDRLEATIQGLEKLTSVLKSRKVAAMIASMLR